jgi:hypothetical protein
MALRRGHVQVVGGVLEVNGPAVRWALTRLVPGRLAIAITLGHVVLGRDARAGRTRRTSACTCSMSDGAVLRAIIAASVWP